MRFRLALAVIVVGLACGAALAADPQTSPPRTADEEAIREATRQYVDALARGDLAAVAEFWVPDGDLIDEAGQVTAARDLFSAEHKAPAEAGKTQIQLSTTALRFLTDDVALEDGTSEVIRPQLSPLRGRFTAIWIKQSGKWRLASLREARIEKPRGPAELAELAWMTGDWSGMHEQSRIDISAHWNSNRTYLIRDLKVIKQGEVVFSGTQRIGWDPITRRIKSWMFDSDGGHAEGIWTREGDAWIVQAHGVLPDGRRTSSTNLYTFDNADSFTWKSTGATTNGVEMPEFVVKLERRTDVK